MLRATRSCRPHVTSESPSNALCSTDRHPLARSFTWFDANLDNPRYANCGTPNDLEIDGVVGHPQVTGDVHQGVLELAGFLYWRAKGGLSSFGETLSGTDVDLSLLPMAYQLMVRNWKIHTAVTAV